MYKYQNISDVEQTITASGNITPRVVEAGGEFTSEIAIENPNFKYLGSTDSASVQGVVRGEQANAVSEAQLSNETNKEIQ